MEKIGQMVWQVPQTTGNERQLKVNQEKDPRHVSRTIAMIERKKERKGVDKRGRFVQE